MSSLVFFLIIRSSNEKRILFCNIWNYCFDAQYTQI